MNQGHRFNCMRCVRKSSLREDQDLVVLASLSQLTPSLMDYILPKTKPKFLSSFNQIQHYSLLPVLNKSPILQTFPSMKNLNKCKGYSDSRGARPQLCRIALHCLGPNSVPKQGRSQTQWQAPSKSSPFSAQNELHYSAA